MSYKCATDLSIGPIFTKFYGEKDGDTPQTPNIDFSKFMRILDGLILGGYPPHVRVSLQGMILTTNQRFSKEAGRVREGCVSARTKTDNANGKPDRNKR